MWSDDGEQKEQLTLSRDGEGTAKFINGDQYTGQYLNGKRHGRGTYKHHNGCHYDGQWDNGLKHGQGALTYPDKGKFTGEWVAGKRDGYGVYEYKGGDVYSGGWKAGVKSGKGVYKFAAGGEVVRGEWSNGVLVDGSWEQNGSRYLGRFKSQQPHGHAVVVNGRGHTAAGNYSANTFTPATAALPSSSAPSTSTTPIIPAPLTLATRLLENTVLSIDHVEGVYRLKKDINGAPNFRRVADTPVFLLGQPTVEAVKAVVAAVQEAGLDRLVWLDTRSECVVYVADRPFTPRHPKHRTQPLTLPVLSKEDMQSLEAGYAAKVEDKIACRGGLLPFIQPTYADLPSERQYIQLEEAVAGPVRSSAQLFAALVEEEGWQMEYDRLRLTDGSVRVTEVDALLQRLRAVEEGTAIIVSDWMGKEQATFAGVIALLLAKVKAGQEEAEEEKEESAEEKTEEAAEASDEKEEGEETAKAEEKEEGGEEQTEEADKEQDAETEEKTEEAKEAKAEETAESEKTEPTDASEQPSTTEDKPASAEGTEPPTATEATEPTAEQQPQTEQTQPAETTAEKESPAEVEQQPVKVLAAEERIALMRSGQYAAINALLPLLPVPSAAKFKAAVDATVDRVSAMVNVREAIIAAWERFEASEDKEGQQGKGWIQLGREGIERYSHLLLVYAYLLDTNKKPAAATEEAGADSGEAEAVPVVTFAAWLQSRPQLLQIIRSEVDSFLWNV